MLINERINEQNPKKDDSSHFALTDLNLLTR